MKKTVLLLALTSITFSIFSQQKLPEDVVRTVNERLEQGHSPSIVIGIIDKNGPQYYSFGTKSIGGQPVDQHTIYEIGSISKTFTAILLAQMAMKGQVKIDDPAQKYLPATVKMPTRNGKQISLGQLSDHSSGLPRLPSNLAPKNAANPYADYSVEELYYFLNQYQLARDIGSSFEYSNLGVGLLGHILSLNAGEDYEKLLTTNITSPLGMKETKITLDGNMQKNLAMGYSNGGPVSNWDMPTLAGAGAIRSSLHDLLRYVAANVGLQETELQAAMNLTHQPRRPTTRDSIGLAWFITKGADGDVTWHTGGTGGYRTFCGFVKQAGKGVVVLTNSDRGADDIGMHLLNPDAKLIEVKKSATTEFVKVLDAKGMAAALKRYDELKKDSGDYEWNEDAMNAIGYAYLGSGKIAEAIAVFKINVEQFPGSYNVYDSYGEALMKNGNKEAAITNYKRSLELNPANTNATDMLVQLGAIEATTTVKIDDNILAGYVGVYELRPGFTITITKESSRLFAQATAQQKLELFPKSTTEFYVKEVVAQVVFAVEDGKADSLTLIQAGKKMPGKRVK